MSNPKEQLRAVQLQGSLFGSEAALRVESLLRNYNDGRRFC